MKGRLTSRASASAVHNGISSNFLWMAWSGTASILNSVLIWIVIARQRSVEEVAHFAIVMGLYALFFSVVSLGLMPYLVNEITRRADNKANGSMSRFLGSSTVLLIGSGFILAFLMTLSASVVSASLEVQLSAAVLSLALIPTGAIALFEASSIAQDRTRRIAAITTIENVLRTLVPIAILLADGGLVAVCLSFAAVRFIALGAYLATDVAAVRKFEFCRQELKRLLSIAGTFGSTIIVASFNWQAVLIVLGYLGTHAETAALGTASRFLIPVTILMASYVTVMQPALARLAGSPDEIGRYLVAKARLPLGAAAAASIASGFLARPVLELLFGMGYGDAAPVLNILALSTIPFCVVMIASRGLIALSKQRVDLIANVIGAGICVTLAVVAIPRYGAIGAAAAQLIAFLAMALFEVAYLIRAASNAAVLRPVKA